MTNAGLVLPDPGEHRYWSVTKDQWGDYSIALYETGNSNKYYAGDVLIAESLTINASHRTPERMKNDIEAAAFAIIKSLENDFEGVYFRNETGEVVRND